jgi:hypothetical protein
MMGFAITVMEVKQCSLKAMLVAVDITKPWPLLTWCHSVMSKHTSVNPFIIISILVTF